MIWALCLLYAAGSLREAHAAVLTKPSRAEDEAAPQEQVNLLIFGVIQFSESLNYVYETTAAKMAKIGQAMRGHEGTLQTLGRQAEQAAGRERQMKDLIELLQAQMALQQAQTMMTKEWLASVEREEAELKTKVRKLEMYLDNSASHSIKELQERVEEHSDALKGLQQLTQFHKENIETQTEQLSKLQRMSEAMTYF